MKSQYVAKNTVVCVAGNIVEKKIIKNVQKLFSQVLTKDFKRRPKVQETQKQPEVLLEFRKTGQTQIALGSRGYTLSHKDRFAQEILAVILGGGMSSRLFMEIREKLGLAYYRRTVSELSPDTGYLSTFAG